MFKCKFANMYDNDIFSKFNIKPVAEDYFKVSNNAFCVADGVTRDNIKGEAVCYPKTEEQAREWIKYYPNPSGAYTCAKICADNFVSKIEKEDNISKEIVKKVIQEVNKDILEINKNREIDYAKEDLYCCEAVGGKIVENKLFCFSIGDCHIIALDKNNQVVFSTINNHNQFEDYLNNIYIKTHNYDWNNREDRIMVRREYRNKPDKKYQGKDISFGALTGEKEAEYYIDVYEVDLKDVSYICAYSDGCEPYFDDKEKIKQIIQNPQTIAEEGKERTLVIYEKV